MILLLSQYFAFVVAFERINFVHISLVCVCVCSCVHVCDCLLVTLAAGGKVNYDI